MFCELEQISNTKKSKTDDGFSFFLFSVGASVTIEKDIV